MKDILLSKENFYFFTLDRAMDISAIFKQSQIISYIYLDSTNAGFNQNDETTIINVGEDVLRSYDVIVNAKTSDGLKTLEYKKDYIIDLGGYDYNVPGEYVITYTLIENKEVNAILKVVVEDKYYIISLYSEPNKGYVKVNDKICDSPYKIKLGYNDKVKISVSESKSYSFVGWYEANIGDDGTFVINEKPYSTDIDTVIYNLNRDITLYAEFKDAIISLTVDGSDAGLGENVTQCFVGENNINLDKVKLIAKTKYEEIILYKDIDFVIDYGKLDLNIPGEYEIIFTLTNDSKVKTSHKIIVLEFCTLEVMLDYDSGVVNINGDSYRNTIKLNVKPKTELILSLTLNDEYNFIGWYYVENIAYNGIILSEKPITTINKFTFTVELNTIIFAKCEKIK